MYIIPFIVNKYIDYYFVFQINLKIEFLEGGSISYMIYTVIKMIFKIES